MATSSIEKKFAKLRVRVESLNMSKEEKGNFFGISGIAFVRKRKRERTQVML